ncbi:MAG: NFACT RNA binding domain-containing protein [Planctomycetota bacterium]|jgi:predicted ribosome quality control (RQC) complex YloA/Tae2 family protein
MKPTPESQSEVLKSLRPGSEENGLSLFNEINIKTLQLVKKEKKRLVNLQADLDDCALAERLRKKGELLKVNLHLIKRGMDSVVVKDILSAAPAADFVIELDPCRPAKEQVNAFFKKAQKFERGRIKIAELIKKTERKISELTALSSKIAECLAEDLPAEEKDKLFSEAVRFGLYKISDKNKKSGNGGKRQAVVNKLLRAVRTFKSRDDMTIMVGKSNADNDILTFRIAKGNDWWFHVAPCPGSHVVVKNDGRACFPQETLLDAASLAVYYSKMRDAAQADVHYTQVKYVRRIKGAPPGKVRLERNDSVRVRMESSRLERIFSFKDSAENG